MRATERYMGILALLLVSASLWGAAGLMDNLFYIPWNGTWQNFYAVSRLGEGERPYVDYLNYLGMGPSLVFLPGYLLGGGLYGPTVAFAQAASTAVFLASAALLLRLAGVRGFRLAWASVVIASVGSVVMPGVSELIRADNTALGVRAFGPILFVFLSAVVITRLGASWRGAGLVGGLAGLAPFWSNDVGFATSAGLLVFVACTTFRDGGTARAAVTLLGSAVVAAAVMVLASAVITCGDPGAFLGELRTIADFQSWYYASSLVGAGNGILDGLLFAFRLDAALTLGIGIYRFARWTRGGGVPDLAIAAICGITLLSALVSILGGNLLPRYFAACARLAWVYAVFEIGCRVDGLLAASRFRILRAAPLAIIAAGMLVWSAGVLTDVVRGNPDHRSDLIAVEDLGGALPGYYQRALKDMRAIRAELDAAGVPARERFLSIYYGGLDVVGGGKPAFRQNYLLHAMSPEDRAAWRDGARRMPYAITLSPSGTDWFYWSRAANWEVVREIYLGFDPVADYGHNLLWKRRDHPRASNPSVAQCEILQSAAEAGDGRLMISGVPEGYLAEVTLGLAEAGPDQDGFLLVAPDRYKGSSKLFTRDLPSRQIRFPLEAGVGGREGVSLHHRDSASFDDFEVKACDVSIIQDPLRALPQPVSPEPFDAQMRVWSNVVTINLGQGETGGAFRRGDRVRIRAGGSVIEAVFAGFLVERDGVLGYFSLSKSVLERVTGECGSSCRVEVVALPAS